MLLSVSREKRWCEVRLRLSVAVLRSHGPFPVVLLRSAHDQLTTWSNTHWFCDVINVNVVFGSHCLMRFILKLIVKSTTRTSKLATWSLRSQITPHDDPSDCTNMQAHCNPGRGLRVQLGATQLNCKSITRFVNGQIPFRVVQPGMRCSSESLSAA